jgi:TonB family protein
MRPALAVAALLALAAAALIRDRLAPSPPAAEGVAAVAGLHVVTEPPGAAVLLDGAEVGRSPLALPSVAPGSHTLRVSREGFAPAELSFVLQPGMTLAPFRFVLQPVTAALEVRSDPAPASVLVDGKGVGETPLAGVLLAPGLHEVRVERPGFLPWTRSVEAQPGEPVALEARLERGSARPEPPPARLKEGDLVELTPDVTPPRKISGDPASYPEAARRARLLGTVAVEMIVDERGEPRDLRVVESAGEVLDEAVLKAVRTWRFEPAQKDGVKVRVRWQARQRFQYGS